MRKLIAAALLLTAQPGVTQPRVDENDWLVMMDREFCDGNKWNDRGNDQRDAMQMLLRHNERHTDLVFTGPTFTKVVVNRLKGQQSTLSLVGVDHEVKVRTGTFGDNEALILEDVEPITISSMKFADALQLTVGTTRLPNFQLKGAGSAIQRFVDCHFLAPQAAVIDGFDFSKF